MCHRFTPSKQYVSLSLKIMIFVELLHAQITQIYTPRRHSWDLTTCGWNSMVLIDGDVMAPRAIFAPSQVSIILASRIPRTP